MNPQPEGDIDMVHSVVDMLAGDSLRAKFLDRTIPLRGASHAEVVEYSTDIPMRYTEFYALLSDGRKVRLRDATQFVAVSGSGSRRSFLFRGCQGRIELQSDTEKPIGVAWPSTAKRKFVARDGSQIIVRRWGRIFARNLSAICGDVETSGVYALTQPQQRLPMT